MNNIETLKSGLEVTKRKVIETGAIQKLGCGFLFAFHSNYGDILYRLRDIANSANYISLVVDGASVYATDCQPIDLAVCIAQGPLASDVNGLAVVAASIASD